MDYCLHEASVLDSERELMLQCANGDQGAFDALFERYRNRIYEYLAHHAPDTAVAEDLLQETFLRLYLHRHRYRPEIPVKSWLFAIATNLLHDEKKKRRRGHDGSLSDAPPEASGDGEAAASGAEAALERVEVKQAVEAAIRALPVPLREAFLLRQREGMSYTELASAVGCSEACVRQRVSRALRQLRQDLSEYAKNTR